MSNSELNQLSNQYSGSKLGKTKNDNRAIKPVCNLCGCDKFIDSMNRKKVKCKNCGSVERTRIIMLYLKKFLLPQPGMKVLHLAPDYGLSKYFSSILGNNYVPTDINPDRYKKKGITNVRKLDLCKDLDNWQTESFDIVVHLHVLEHIPCNYTAVLIKLNRLLKPSEKHIFGVPVMGKAFLDSFGSLSPDENRKYFGQQDHIRRLSSSDLKMSLGMVVPVNLDIHLDDEFSEQELIQYNIPKSKWRNYVGSSLFFMDKSDLLL